jgi:putative ABC transport system substrate-binding protein
MRRRELLALFGGAMAAARIAHAEKKLPVIGMLSSHKIAGADFDKGLNDAGLDVGGKAHFIYAYAGDRYDDLPQMAADLVRQKVDVIAAFGVTEAKAAKRATDAIPIVISAEDDPVAEGLAVDLARPGGNLTGVLMMNAEFVAKQLDLLSVLVPESTSFALLVNPKAAYTPAVSRKAQEMARAKGIGLHILQASTDDEIDAAFATLSGLKVDGLVVEGEKLFDSRAVDGRLVLMAARAALPTIYNWGMVALTGGLITYGANREVARQQMGQYVGRILQGAKPADLPFVRASKLELCINMKTAKALGVSVPQALLAQADQVIS